MKNESCDLHVNQIIHLSGIIIVSLFLYKKITIEGDLQLGHESPLAPWARGFGFPQLARD